MGTIVLIAALITIFRLMGQKNINFLRFMMIIILVTSIMEIGVGCIILAFINVKDI